MLFLYCTETNRDPKTEVIVIFVYRYTPTIQYATPLQIVTLFGPPKKKILDTPLIIETHPNWELCSLDQEKDTIISISLVRGLSPWYPVNAQNRWAWWQQHQQAWAGGITSEAPFLATVTALHSVDLHEGSEDRWKRSTEIMRGRSGIGAWPS